LCLDEFTSLPCALGLGGENPYIDTEDVLKLLIVGDSAVRLLVMGVHPTSVHLIGGCLMGIYLTGVHLMGGCLMGMYLTGVYLMGVYLLAVYLTGVHPMGVH
jgi:hypothetical protein